MAKCDRYREERLAKTRERKYGLDKVTFNKLIERSGGSCEICGYKPVDGATGKDRLHLDHCHNTQQIRGLLCRKCNTAIGLLQDDPQILETAANYIREHSGKS